MNWWNTHGPKIVNGITLAVGALSTPTLGALVPPSALPWVIAANTLLNIVHNVQHNAVAPMPTAP